MDEEGLGFYGALDRNVFAPNMESGYMRLTYTTDDTVGSYFCPRHFPVMGFDGAAAAVSIAGRIIHHPLFNCSGPCHCVSSGCLYTATPSHLDAVGGIICLKWSRWRCLCLKIWTYHNIRSHCPLYVSVDVSLQVVLPEICATTLV